MAGNITIRTLVSKLVLQGFDQAVKGLKKYRDDWNITAKVVDAAASAVERSAARASAAMAGMASGAAAVRAAAGGGGGGGGPRAPRAPRGPTEAQEVARQAREQERARREQVKQEERQRRADEAQARRDAQDNERARRALERQAAQASRSARPSRPAVDPLDAAIAAANKSEAKASQAAARSGARQAGLAQGAAPLNEATAALGRFATASDKAKAKVSDLSAQVARNRKDMADLQVQIVKTGDADGTLAAKKQALAAETLRTSAALGRARNELRALDGGLIQAIKSASVGKITVEALGTALGNLASRAITGTLSGVKDVIGGSTKAAMDFEKALVDVAKVAQDADLTKDGLLDPRVKAGIKEVSKELGVMPTEVAELTAQITAAFSGKTDIVALAKDVTKIGVAWDISGKQAGEFFKQTSAGLQINADETKALFGSINELGNKLGVQSSQIAEAMTRSAGVLKGANLSGETGAALNATLIKAGASAEVAATGVRTFVARLGAGEAATDKQIKAFNALGLSAKDVAKNLASGDAAKAEQQIKEVVGALVKMGETAPEQRMATLIELFGSESIGSIGAAATAVETLATSFDIAGNKAAALTSVQAEYDRVSNTSAARVEKLKANIGVLAIEMGEKLLPYVDRLVNFLTSPEGQEWGARAAATAAGIFTSLADVVGVLAGAFVVVTENLGAATTAVGLLAIAVGALLGPWGLALTGAVALGAYLGGPFVEQVERAREAEFQLAKGIVDGGKALQELTVDVQRTDGVFAKLSDRWREIMLRILGATDALNEFHRRQDAEEVRAGKLAHTEAMARETERQRSEYARRTDAAGKEDARRRTEQASGGDHGRFRELLEMRSLGTLRPSEQSELKALSKKLDLSLPPEKKKRGAGHKSTKMDKQLAAMDPSLAKVLRQGGDEDSGGDLKVSSDPLSRAVYARATGSSAGGGSGGVGPGPNITNNIYNNNVNVTQSIDARSTAPAVENLRQAAYDGAQQVGNVTFTGLQRVLTLRTSGGRMA